MIIVVLPAFNEEDALKPLLDNLSNIIKEHFQNTHTIVVDDGSTDRTADVVKSYQKIPIELIEHGRNRGLGEAINTGLLSALRIAEEGDIIVTMDADNTHNPGLLLKMVMLVEEGNDVVIASRYLLGARVVGVTACRQLCGLGVNWLFRILFPIPGVKDYTCGYRAYRAGKLIEAFKRWGDDLIGVSGFSCNIDILLKLRELGAIMAEAPMTLRYDLKPGKSKMDVRKTITETLLLAFWRKFGMAYKRSDSDNFKQNKQPKKEAK